jgi:hypothetical protein
VTSYDKLGEYIGITEVYAVQAWCRSVAKGRFVVEFSDTADTASIYRDKIVFPRPNVKMTVRDAIKMRGFMVHETSHPLYQPDYNDVVDKYKVDMSKPFGMVWNVLLDCHAESCRARGWPGDAKALSEFGTVTGMHLSEKLVPQLTSPETIAKGLDPNFDRLSIVMLAHVAVEGTWNNGMRISFAPLVEAFGEERSAKAHDIIVRFNLRDRLLDQNETAESILFLAQDVYKYLWGDAPPQEEGKDKPSKEKGEGGEKKDGPNESGNDKDEEGEKGGEPESDDGEGDAAKDGENPEDSEQGEDGENPLEQGSTLKLTELLFTDHYKRDNPGNAENKGGEGQHFDYSAYKECSRYEPCDPARVVVVNFD